MADNAANSRFSTSEHTICCLIGFYGLAMLSGVREIYAGQESLIDLLMTPALAICLGCWCVFDAGRRHRPIPMSARKWFILGFGILTPGYLIWTRGWRGLGWIILHLFLWYLFCVIGFILGWVFLAFLFGI